MPCTIVGSHVMYPRIALLTGLLFLSACASEEARIKEQIAEANHCETADDCTDAGAKCPFDCYIFVNKSEVGRIKALVDGYDSQCEYSCLAITGVQCVQNKCQPIQDTAPAADENPEGNPGAACTAHTDCQTPMDYLIRSVCPFGSRCIDGTCNVVCPMMNHDPDPKVSASAPVACTADSECQCEGFAGDGFSCQCVDRQCVAVVERR